jgi:hypothetical protein
MKENHGENCGKKFLAKNAKFCSMECYESHISQLKISLDSF